MQDTDVCIPSKMCEHLNNLNGTIVVKQREKYNADK